MKHYPKLGARPRGDGREQFPAVKPATGWELVLVWAALLVGGWWVVSLAF